MVSARARGGPAHARRWPWWALAALLLLVAALVALRQPLAERLLPSTRIDRLLAEGGQALAQGRLDQADGQGARQKFEAALALDSDRGEARAGLAKVGQAALVQARGAIDAGDATAAARWLALAGDLQVPRAQWQAEHDRLQRMEAAAIDLEGLRAAAAARLGDGDPEAALPLYAQVLALQPGDVAALEGREDALALLLERVHGALRTQDLAAAARWLGQVRGYDPGHVDLPAAQAQVAQALEAQRQLARRHLRQGRLERAAAAFAALGSIAADDPDVADGIRATAAALASRARQLSAEFRFDAAERDLAHARELAPDLAAVRDATRAIARDRAMARRRLMQQGAPAQAPRAALQAFDAAMAQRHWITPPGTSAYDQLRRAQAAAPVDPAVLAAAARLRDAVQGCVEVALRGNRLRQAQDCHDAWQALAPADPAQVEARQRLAQRWLAVGEERLRAGELEVAAQALRAVRRLEPDAPGVAEFSVQLERARSSPRPP
ncbi:hypothetical protein [Pseudoxanthomonas koreensis]|uniref:hypothetical protein n=1 Tax=Pseudoxanthomonas koreensis TaxID=266061 RepID=UPI0035A74576